MKNKSLAVLAMAIVVVSFTGCAPKVNTGSPAISLVVSNVVLTAAQRQNIHFYTVEPSSYHKTVEATGIVDFDQDQATAVLAPFSGPVSQLLVSLGQQVKAEDPLATVSSPDFATAINTYRKTIAVAKNARQLADLDQQLLQHHGVSQREASQAQSDAISAESDRDAAREALVSLRVDAQTISDIEAGRPVSQPAGTIRSPIAGTVVEKLITPGQLLQAGTTPCFTVADLSRVWVMTHLFGADINAVKLGDTTEIVTDVSSNLISGTVDNISAEIDPDSRSVIVRAVVDNPEQLLKRQMYVRVLIQASEASTGLLAPVSAILRDDENLPFVYVVQPDGSFARQSVTLGYRTGDQYDIVSGLKSGDQIVTEGGIFVQFVQNQ